MPHHLKLTLYHQWLHVFQGLLKKVSLEKVTLLETWPQHQFSVTPVAKEAWSVTSLSMKTTRWNIWQRKHFKRIAKVVIEKTNQTFSAFSTLEVPLLNPVAQTQKEASHKLILIKSLRTKRPNLQLYCDSYNRWRAQSQTSKERLKSVESSTARSINGWDSQRRNVEKRR